jgi:hypothetical protein
MNCFHAQEKYGNTFNIGAGLGYHRYIRLPFPAFNINYEFDVAPNLTLAPFVSLLSYRENGYLYGGKYYGYHNTIVPIGVKGYYYFDKLINLDSKFDVYAGLSLGFNVSYGNWDDGYKGPSYISHYSPLYVDFHIGGEWRLKENMGLYLDLSSGFSTLGLAFHR